VPRAWLQEDDPTRTSACRCGPAAAAPRARADGAVACEAQVSGLDAILVGGRWFAEHERQVVLMSERMRPAWGSIRSVRRPCGLAVGHGCRGGRGVFRQAAAGAAGPRRRAADAGHLPREASAELTEEEVDALESGEDVREFQSRYQHNPGDVTLIVPYPTLMSAGGSLKAVAVRDDSRQAAQASAQDLIDRFGLSLFSGEPEGIFLYHASDTISYSGVPNIIIPLAISSSSCSTP